MRLFELRLLHSKTPIRKEAEGGPYIYMVMPRRPARSPTNSTYFAERRASSFQFSSSSSFSSVSFIFPFGHFAFTSVIPKLFPSRHQSIPIRLPSQFIHLPCVPSFTLLFSSRRSSLRLPPHAPHHSLPQPNYICEKWKTIPHYRNRPYSMDSLRTSSSEATGSQMRFRKLLFDSFGFERSPPIRCNKTMLRWTCRNLSGWNLASLRLVAGSSEWCFSMKVGYEELWARRWATLHPSADSRNGTNACSLSTIPQYRNNTTG
jgi:hypothetical protein